MELRYYLRLLRRWWWLLIVSLIVTTVPAYFITHSMAPTYRSTTTVFVNMASAPNAITYSDALLSQQLVMTYSQMAQQPVVLEEVRSRLDLPYSMDRLGQMISAEPRRDTQLFEIAVSGRDPQQIRDIANTVAEVFIEQQREFLPTDQEEYALRIAQPALEPTSPVSPNPLRNTILAGFIGLMIASGLVMLYEYLDDTVKTPEDLEAAVAMPTLGTVMMMDKKSGARSAPIIMGADRRYSHLPEAYRLVRTNLEFASIDQPLKTILIASGSPGEGKSTTAAGLASIMAQGDKRVILVDADLRKPSLHRIFGLPNQRGLSNLLLADSVNVNGYLQSTGVKGLLLLSSGPLPPNPAELLASSRLSTLLEKLGAEADIVMFDSPPVLAVADAMILASRADGMVLVIDTRKTRPDAVRHTVEALSKSGARLLGGVLNKLSKRSDLYYDHNDYQDVSASGGTAPDITGKSHPATSDRETAHRLRAMATPRNMTQSVD